LKARWKPLSRKLIEAALAGDMTAIKLVLERAAPPRRGRPISVDLPELSGANDVAQIMRCLVVATLQGELTPSEAESVAGLLEGYRRAIESTDLIARIEALEAAHD
jgi:hypothetical protein